MNEKFSTYSTIWSVALGVFSIICFILAGTSAGIIDLDTVFWVTYAFVVCVFICQLSCTFYALVNDSLQKIFCRIPVLTISYIYLLLSFVFGVFTVIMRMPLWITIITDVAMIGVFTVAVVGAKKATK